MFPTRQRPGPPRQAVDCVSSPLRVRTNILQSTKTPDSIKIVVKYKKTPKIHSPKTPKHGGNGYQRKTPGNSRRTPPRSGKKKTPGRSPSGCRFIPNRAAMDLDYSSYLLRKKERREGEGDEEGDASSPARQECQQALLKAISKSRGKGGQKSVLSFSIATPSIAEGMYRKWQYSRIVLCTIVISMCWSKMKRLGPGLYG